ncbi:IclR family transcriptional regulator [Thermocatellispora tengchongensis]|uniref:IclR family transcriptional regulator n=1 Tax=Thermocatellispora tengchongensis TaxID=1073253 RepID=UPI00362B7548
MSLERGLRILSAFTGDRSVLGIADLARAAGLNKSTTHRYVATLTALEFLEQDPETRKYSLGPRAVDLGFAAIDSMELTRVTGPLLQALAAETGFTVSMAVCDGPDIVYVDRRRSGRRSALAMDLNLHVGSRLPAYCTSMGKALLAYKDPAALRQILDHTDMARRGPKTITNREQLLAALARVRQSGVAVNDEELAPGLRSLAAPVRDRSGGVVAAINIAVYLTPAPATVEALSGRLEGPLRRTAAEISRRLGYRPPA